MNSLSETRWVGRGIGSQFQVDFFISLSLFFLKQGTFPKPGMFFLITSNQQHSAKIMKFPWLL